MPDTSRNVRTFIVVTVVCIFVAVGYTIFSTRRGSSHPPAPALSSPTVPPPTAAPPTAPKAGAEPPAAQATASPRAEASVPDRRTVYVVAVNVRDSPGLGTVEFAPVDAMDNRRQTTLQCERIHFAGDVGICLSREVRMLSAQTVATIVDAAFHPVFNVRTNGIPSRARISPDRRYAAFTVFVTGHSYSDTQLSTATVLIDLRARAQVANLEDFVVRQEGEVVRSPDFNFWGVTFAADSNIFYATLRMRGSNYLVRGDIATRTVTIIYKGVECPSLSPDGKRVAFKKSAGRGEWRLAVLDLRTLQVTPLAETRNVDDQAEWLDNERVLYAVTDPMPWMSIKVVAADGRGEPAMFAKGAASPAVVRQFR